MQVAPENWFRLLLPDSRVQTAYVEFPGNRAMPDVGECAAGCPFANGDAPLRQSNVIMKSTGDTSHGLDPSLDFMFLFGVPRIRYVKASREETLGWQRSIALLAYFSCRPEWHSRGALSDFLRPDTNGPDARAYLRRLLCHTRAMLPELCSLEVEEGRIRWNGGSDVRSFDLAIAEGNWNAAIAIQKEPFLHHVGASALPSLDEWFYEERLRLRRSLQVALMAAIRQGQHCPETDCAALMQKLADQDPMDEYVVQFLLAHARSAMERHAAMTALHTLQRRFATELGQNPLPATLELGRRLHSEIPTGVVIPGLPAQSFSPSKGIHTDFRTAVWKMENVNLSR